MRHGVSLLLAAVALLATAAGASAAAPTAVTGSVTAVGATTATVNGTVNPGGVATTWYVEYGTSTTYGSQTAPTSAGSGTADKAVSVSLSSLAQGTTYHYRVVATSSAGTALGGDGIFTTLAAPGAVTAAASSVNASSAKLNGSVDPNGQATTWFFEYGTTTGYGSQTTSKSAGSGTSSTNVSAGISGLQAGQVYHFRLVATSTAGTTNGADVTFTTSSAPSVATAPASSIAPTSAVLNGSVSPNGLSTTWWFQYGTTTAYGKTSSARSAGSGTSAVKESLTLSGLQAATTYHYRIVAKNSSGTTAGNDVAFSTSLPPAVTTGSAQSVTASSVSLTGALDTRGRPTSWWFEYGTKTTYGSKTTSKTIGSKAGTQAVSAPLSKLRNGTLYHYRLVAKSDAGTTYGSDLTFTTLGVTIAATAREVTVGGRLRLTGVVPTHNAGEQVTLYAQAYGRGSPVSIATILTGVGGAWSYLVKPRIGTQYQAGWNGTLSTPTTVGVHPAIALARLANGQVRTHVAGATAFRGRVVQFQRRVGSRWVTVKRVRLNRLSRATVAPRLLPKGRYALRVVMSINQAGAGYLGGKSRVITFTRR